MSFTIAMTATISNLETELQKQRLVVVTRSELGAGYLSVADAGLYCIPLPFFLPTTHIMVGSLKATHPNGQEVFTLIQRCPDGLKTEGRFLPAEGELSLGSNGAHVQLSGRYSKFERNAVQTYNILATNVSWQGELKQICL